MDDCFVCRLFAVPENPDYQRRFVPWDLASMFVQRQRGGNELGPSKGDLIGVQARVDNGCRYTQGVFGALRRVNCFLVDIPIIKDLNEDSFAGRDVHFVRGRSPLSIFYRVRCGDRIFFDLTGVL